MWRSMSIVASVALCLPLAGSANQELLSRQGDDNQ